MKRFDESIFAAEDVERILELGLIGGGLSRADAANLIEQHVSGQPIAPHAVIAFEILAALFVGKAQEEEKTNADA